MLAVLSNHTKADSKNTEYLWCSSLLNDCMDMHITSTVERVASTSVRLLVLACLDLITCLYVNTQMTYCVSFVHGVIPHTHMVYTYMHVHTTSMA